LEPVPLSEWTNDENIMVTTMNSPMDSVPVFSQDGPLFRAIEAQSQQGNDLSNNVVSAVSYFSSNFLKPRR